MPRRRGLELFLIGLLFLCEWVFTLTEPASWPGRCTSGGEVRWESRETVAGSTCRLGAGLIVLQVSEVPLRERWQRRDALIVSNTAVLVENRKLLFKQMASLSIHNQAFNEIKRSRQGCRCVSPDHFGRHQLNCISIFVKSVPRCPPCPLFYPPSFFIFFFFCLSRLSGLGS